MRSDDQLRKKTATLIGLRRESVLYGELQLKRALCYFLELPVRNTTASPVMAILAIVAPAHG